MHTVRNTYIKGEWLPCHVDAHVLLSVTESHLSVAPRCKYMRGSRKFCQRGSNFDKVFLLLFLVDEGRDAITLI